jgi:hypothetical protein
VSLTWACAAVVLSAVRIVVTLAKVFRAPLDATGLAAPLVLAHHGLDVIAQRHICRLGQTDLNTAIAMTDFIRIPPKKISQFF